MKKLLYLLLMTVSSVCAQPVVHFDFLSHNEETNQWNGTPFYTANRARLIQLADYFSSKGITWNLQSDWVYLTNVLSKETTMLKATTNNKNILRWLSEDRGVEIDPHAHESQYLYPDVVKLMDSVGLPESKVIGGTIYNDSNGKNIWTNLVYGQYGRIYTSRFWKPDYIMGGGTPNHVADLKYYGFWNPTSPSNYVTHNPASPLHHIGVGCEMKIRDTTTVASFVAGLKDLVQKVQTGAYPASGIYLQTVFFEQADLNTAAFYNKVLQIADSMAAIVGTGKAQWKTLKQTYTYWETSYSGQPFQWECGQVATVVPKVSVSGVRVFPNPALDAIYIERDGTQPLSAVLFDMLGCGVARVDILDRVGKLDVRNLPEGAYILRLETGKQVSIQRVLIH